MQTLRQKNVPSANWSKFLYIFYRHHFNFQTKMKFLCKEQKLVLRRRRLFFSFLCECVSCSYDATAAKSPLFEVNSIQFRGKEKFNLLSLVYGLKKIPIREFYSLIEQQRQINPTKKACAIMHVQSVESNVICLLKTIALIFWLC